MIRLAFEGNGRVFDHGGHIIREGRMAKRFMAGACLLAFTLSYGGLAEAAKHRGRPPANCAQPTEITAIQVAAVQQQLMVAALSCDPAGTPDTAKEFVRKFNQFQVSYGPELRKSDADMLRMFKRLYGVRKGDDEYNAFKTRTATHSEIRRIHAFGDFCKAANLVFAAALAPQKPTLADFVAGVEVQEETPVSSCAISVAFSLTGTQAGINILPKPKPADL
jgi:hypothetical protein